MVGLGAANLAAGFFQGFPISSSSSRTPVAEAAGARTQLAGVVGAISVALLLVVAPDLLQHLPDSALAAVVIASAIGLIEVTDLRPLRGGFSAWVRASRSFTRSFRSRTDDDHLGCAMGASLRPEGSKIHPNKGPRITVWRDHVDDEIRLVTAHCAGLHAVRQRRG